MGIKKFRISPHYTIDRIDEVEYIGETESYYIEKNKRRTKKESKHVMHFDSWKEAHEMLIELQTSRIARAHERYNTERNALKKIKAMKQK